MKERIRKVLIVLSAVVFLWSVTMLLRQQRDYREGDEIYAEAEQLAVSPDTSAPPTPNVPDDSQTPTAPAAEPLADVELEPLRAVSNAVVGWISIPGTTLSYPLVQGKDNDWYLNHAWNGRTTSVGSIFLDWRNGAGLTDHHTLIYGHRMKNGSMFAALKYYDDPAYLAEYPSVYIKTEVGVRRYDIFAAYEAPVRSVTYRLNLPDDTARKELIDFALAQSVVDAGIVPGPADRILTLSTCTGQGYDTRWVVQAVEVPHAPTNDS